MDHQKALKIVEMATRTKRIAPAQLEMLVSFMELHPALAIAQSKNDDITLDRRRTLWTELLQKLNSVEGCTRKTMDRWKKTWTDQKTKTQIKAVKLIENNGESTKLTPLEERILKIIASSNKTNSTGPPNDKTGVPDAELPLVSQNGIPSVENRDLTDAVLSELSNDSVIETASDAAESLMEAIPVVPISKPEFGIILHETPPLTLTSLDIPILIKQEPPDGVECVAETTPVTETVPSVTTTDSLLNMFATSTSKNIAERAKKRKRFRFNSKYMTAEKAAGTFVSIAERNCIVLERIANAMETQAAEATKQTQLMQDLIDVLRNNK